MEFKELLEMENYFSTALQRGSFSCEDRKHRKLLEPDTGETLGISW